jgi:hypothetical protein
MPLEHFLNNALSETASTQALEHPCLMMKNAQAEIFDIPKKWDLRIYRIEEKDGISNGDEIGWKIGKTMIANICTCRC